jgi:hypothetical protein
MIGRNLSIGDSFTLRFANATSSPFTFNLFNQGGGAAQQTSITTATYSAENSFFVTELTNGVLTAPITFELSQGLTTIVSIPFVIGQTINDIMTAVNPLINLQGQSGTITIQQTVGDITGQLYDIAITTPSITKVSFSGLSQYTPSYLTTSYVTNNPFITIGGVVAITTIQNSETGNSYRIMGVDIISDNPNQLLEDINYGNKTADGNRWTASFTPTIDPYQNNSVSLHAVGSINSIGAAMDEFTISTDTTFSYTVLGNTFSRLTFNYVRASEAVIKEFNQAVASELVMKFAAQKRYLASLKYRQGVFLQ